MRGLHRPFAFSLYFEMVDESYDADHFCTDTLLQFLLKTHRKISLLKLYERNFITEISMDSFVIDRDISPFKILIKCTSNNIGDRRLFGDLLWSIQYYA